MSLIKGNPDNVPKDAVVLGRDEALHYQLEFIDEWKNSSEVWPLRSGVSILGIAASVAGIYINGYYRRKLKLKRIGYFTTYLPIVVLPAIVTGVIHKVFVTYDILLENTKCPICLQVRSAAIQTTMGCIYPLLLAPMGNFMYATRHATYRLPDITKDYFGGFRTLANLARPIGTQLSVIFIGQALLGSYFTYLEVKSYHTVKQRMIEIEKEYEESLENSHQEI